MLEARPKIHGDRAELDLDAHGALPVRKKDGDLHDHVIAAVAVLLGFADVVLDLKHGDVVLAGEHLGDRVDVVDERADDAHARHVVQVLFDRLDGQRQAAAAQLADDAQRALDARGDALDRVAAVAEGKLLVEHLEFGAHLADRRAVAHQKLRKRVEPPVDVLRSVIPLPNQDAQKFFAVDGIAALRAGRDRRQNRADLSGALEIVHLFPSFGPCGPHCFNLL